MCMDKASHLPSERRKVATLTKATKAKFRHLKKLTCKGLCGKRLSKFIDRGGDTVSHLDIFDPSM